MDFLLYFVYKGLGKGHEGTVLTWAIYGFGFTLPAGHLENHEQEAEYMNEISELDLQNLRHLIGGFDTTHCKMDEYARQATDAQVKQFFQKSAQSAADCKNQLMQYLQ